jgi:hypothetical protein
MPHARDTVPGGSRTTIRRGRRIFGLRNRWPCNRRRPVPCNRQAERRDVLRPRASPANAPRHVVRQWHHRLPSVRRPPPLVAAGGGRPQLQPTSHPGRSCEVPAALISLLTLSFGAVDLAAPFFRLRAELRPSRCPSKVNQWFQAQGRDGLSHAWEDRGCCRLHPCATAYATIGIIASSSASCPQSFHPAASVELGRPSASAPPPVSVAGRHSNGRAS